MTMPQSYIYCAKYNNIICYIGQTSDPDGYRTSHYVDAANKAYNLLLPLDRAIRDLGADNFKFVTYHKDGVLWSTQRSYELYCMENILIKKYRTLMPNGYNQTINTRECNICLNYYPIEQGKYNYEHFKRTGLWIFEDFDCIKNHSPLHH